MIGEYITMQAANPTENLNLLIVYPIKQKNPQYFMACKIVFSSIQFALLIITFPVIITNCLNMESNNLSSIRFQEAATILIFPSPWKTVWVQLGYLLFTPGEQYFISSSERIRG